MEPITLSLLSEVHTSELHTELINCMYIYLHVQSYCVSPILPYMYTVLVFYNGRLSVRVFFDLEVQMCMYTYVHMCM